MSDTQKSYPRFRVMARIEHAILLISFTMLAVTGLPQMYAQLAISESAIRLMGGIESVRLLHRYMAVLLIAGSVYHLLTATYRLFVRGERMRIMLRPRDAADLWQTIKYNLGFTDVPPKMPKFNFGEKIEYWAVIWGTAVMVITGFMLWNPIATTTILPGAIIPAALAAHGGEAVLAVLSIVIWHLYNVLVKHRNFSIFTGSLPHHQMEEEHAEELERLEQGGDPYPGLALTASAGRQRIFVVVSIIVGGLTIAGLIWAFSFEQTAIETVPRVTQDVFVPLSTLTP